jgi:hypothetical protein
MSGLRKNSPKVNIPSLMSVFDGALIQSGCIGDTVKDMTYILEVQNQI